MCSIVEEVEVQLKPDRGDCPFPKRGESRQRGVSPGMVLVQLVRVWSRYGEASRLALEPHGTYLLATQETSQNFQLAGKPCILTHRHQRICGQQCGNSPDSARHTLHNGIRHHLHKPAAQTRPAFSCVRVAGLLCVTLLATGSNVAWDKKRGPKVSYESLGLGLKP